MKRVCFVTSGVLPVPAVRGGAVEQLVQQLCEDNERTPRFEIICITQYDEEAVKRQSFYCHTQFVNIKTGGRMLRWVNKKMHALIRHITGKSIPRVYIYGFCADKYLMRHVDEFDMVIAEACDLLLLKPLSKRIGREKLCLHVHGPLQANFDLESIYGNILAISDFIKRNYMITSHIMSENNALILMNAIDINRFDKSLPSSERDELRARLGIGKFDFVTIFCGRIIKEKGISQLMQAVIGIKDSSFKLLIVGSSDFGNGNKGAYPKEVLKLSKQYKDRILFTGFIKNENLWKYYKLADIGVVPSLWTEPFCLVLLEMMASGLPTIATRMGGIPEVATSETTTFVENDSCIVDSLRGAILNLHSSPNKRKEMSQAAVKRSLKFDRSKYFEKFCQQVNYLIEKNESRK